MLLSHIAHHPLFVVQVSAMIPFKADIAFVSKLSGSTSRSEERIRSLTGDSLTGHFEQKQKQFDDKFQRCFDMSDEVSIMNVSSV